MSSDSSQWLGFKLLLETLNPMDANLSWLQEVLCLLNGLRGDLQNKPEAVKLLLGLFLEINSLLSLKADACLKATQTLSQSIRQQELTPGTIDLVYFSMSNPQLSKGQPTQSPRSLNLAASPEVQSDCLAPGHSQQLAAGPGANCLCFGCQNLNSARERLSILQQLLEGLDHLQAIIVMCL